MGLKEQGTSLNKGDKIFISHHHSQKEALSSLKADLEKIGFEAFLAHDDIPPGEYDLDTIERRLKECDALLYICNEKSNASIFCQQEIGMAVALKKKIIPVSTEKDKEKKDKILPKGFIARLQTPLCLDLNNIFSALFEHLSTDSEIKRHLEILGCKGFSQQEKEGYIYLEKGGWNDYGYETLMGINLNGERLGHVKITFNGQAEGTHSFDELPAAFKCLGKSFFSTSSFESEDFSEEQKNSIKALLRDFASLEFEERKKIHADNQYLLVNSLFRWNTEPKNTEKEELNKLITPLPETLTDRLVKFIRRLIKIINPTGN